jgi:hypothetical protein
MQRASTFPAKVLSCASAQQQTEKQKNVETLNTLHGL